MTTGEITGAAAFGVTILGFLLRSAFWQGRVETKLDTAINRVEDHETRLRMVEADQRSTPETAAPAAPSKRRATSTT